MHRLLSAACLAVTATAAACSTAPAPGHGPSVVATTEVWADVVRHVACGGGVTVHALVPAGADPHGFEASLRDRGRLGAADLVVANGLGLEETLADTLESVERDGVPVLEVAAHAPDLLDVSGHEHHDHDHGDGEPHHGEEQLDPHVWYDPVRVAATLDVLASALVEHAGLDANEVERCAAAYREELLRVDEEVASIFAGVPAERRLLATDHGSLAYLADRYGLEVVGSVLPSSSTMAEAGPAELEELVATLERTGAPAVAVEAGVGSDTARAVARAAGVELVVIGPGDDGPGGYVDQLVADARALARALAPAEVVR